MHDRENTLPPDGVTRRDFVGGTLAGAGTALLGMGSPAALREAQAQTVAFADERPGPDWTGPGGIGDYARSNGNTHEVVNAAHGGIRNQEFDKRLRAAVDTGETPGCGHRRLRDRRALGLLDVSQGRARTARC